MTREHHLRSQLTVAGFTEEGKVHELRSVVELLLSYQYSPAGCERDLQERKKETCRVRCHV